VKTLHPRLHAGILARRDSPKHLAAIKAAGIEPIDLVVVNLYPFAQTVANRIPLLPKRSRTSTSAVPACCARQPRTMQVLRS